MLLSQGDLRVFVERPISAAFLAVGGALVLGQLYVRWRKKAVLVPDGPAVMEG